MTIKIQIIKTIIFKMRKLTILFLVAAAFMQISCTEKQAQKQTESSPEVLIEKIAETSQSWDGANLPNYPEGQPVITIMRYVFPPKMRLDEHYHSIINCGVVMSGELTIITREGIEKTFKKGDAIIEIINGIHYGENRGDEPAEIIMFYAGEPDSPLSIKS
ncbi:MAG: cupin domain-containing protein [Bacteroidales bacterium]